MNNLARLSQKKSVGVKSHSFYTAAVPSAKVGKSWNVLNSAQLRQKISSHYANLIESFPDPGEALRWQIPLVWRPNWIISPITSNGAKTRKRVPQSRSPSFAVRISFPCHKTTISFQSKIQQELLCIFEIHSWLMAWMYDFDIWAWS